MATRSLASFRALLESLPGGSKSVVPTDMQNNTPPEHEVQQTLNDGDNTISIPTLAIGCLVIFADGSTYEKTLKYNAGDAGFPLRLTGWIVLTFSAVGAPTGFIINIASAEASEIVRVIFF